jgi:hypothetical protein
MAKVLTINKILKYTEKLKNPSVVDNSEVLKIKSYTVTKKKIPKSTQDYYDANIKVMSPESTVRRNMVYNVRVVANTKEFDKAIRVSCDCQFFKYWGCGDVLNLYNATFSTNVTGFMPDTRNPRYVPFVCKHAYIAMQEIKRRQ